VAREQRRIGERFSIVVPRDYTVALADHRGEFKNARSGKSLIADAETDPPTDQSVNIFSHAQWRLFTRRILVCDSPEPTIKKGGHRGPPFHMPPLKSEDQVVGLVLAEVAGAGA
jgi:hypothetical protein